MGSKKAVCQCEYHFRGRGRSCRVKHTESSSPAAMIVLLCPKTCAFVLCLNVSGRSSRTLPCEFSEHDFINAEEDSSSFTVKLLFLLLMVAADPPLVTMTILNMKVGSSSCSLNLKPMFYTLKQFKPHLEITNLPTGGPKNIRTAATCCAPPTVLKLFDQPLLRFNLT